MSRSTNDYTTSQETRKSTPVPRAVIHKQILDAALDRPDASMSELADGVNGASVDLVEQVLEEYGDPAADEPSVDEPEAATDVRDGDPPDLSSRSAAEASPDGPKPPEPTPADRNESVADGGVRTGGERESKASGQESDDSEYGSIETDRSAELPANDAGDSVSVPAIDPDELSETERRTLLAIRDRPDATQQELADRFDVTAATINRRVNDIEGFDWSNREAIVAELFPEDAFAEGEPDAARESEDAQPDAVDGASDVVDGALDADSAGGADEHDSADLETDEHEFDERSTTGGDDESETAEPDDGPTDPPNADELAASAPESNSSGCETDDSGLETIASRVESLTRAVEALERRLDSEGAERGVTPADSALIAKAMHACMRSDRISEDEELELLETFLGED